MTHTTRFPIDFYDRYDPEEFDERNPYSVSLSAADLAGLYRQFGWTWAGTDILNANEIAEVLKTLRGDAEEYVNESDNEEETFGCSASTGRLKVTYEGDGTYEYSLVFAQDYGESS